ncbi:MAG TPA: nuclear transport factor 2 family protein [Candidatus Dormibacteraeota bacterium]|nr:nuclear transport factor 2 family protein [Candidatus Dormibacteraeota bacterium]
MDDDRDAIAALVHAYAERLDAGDLDGVAALFATAAVRGERSGTAHRGSKAIAEFYRRTVVLYDGSPCTRHVITNLVIDLDHDGAAASRCVFTVLQARPELPLQAILAGRYHDRFTRTGGTWAFSERRILTDLVGDLRWHVRR